MTGETGKQELIRIRPRLKPAFWYRENGQLSIASATDQIFTLSDPDGHLELLLDVLVSRERPLAELLVTLERDHAIGADETLSHLEALSHLGLLGGQRETPLLSPAERERLASNLAFFDGYGTPTRSADELQGALLSAHVLVLGVGGVGAMVLMHLVGLGVRRLTLVDADSVESRNFTRQFVYRTQDLGAPKVECAAAWVRAFDPAVEVSVVNRRIEGVDDVSPLLDGVDFVVAAVDHPAELVRLWINEACVTHFVPFVEGGATGRHVVYSSIHPGRSACLQCREHQRAATAVERARAAGVSPGALDRVDGVNRTVAPAAGLLGALFAFEAVRYLTGVAPPIAAGVERITDVITGEETVRAWPAHSGCPTCARAPDARTSDAAPAHLQAEMGAGPPDNPDVSLDRPLEAATRLRLKQLSIVPQGEEFIVGDPSTGEFAIVPELGKLIIESIRDGHPLAQVAIIAAQSAGEIVDVFDFAATLLELGFVETLGAASAPDAPERLSGPRGSETTVRLCQPLFSRLAWAFYCLALLACVGVTAATPQYRPHESWLFFARDPLESVALAFGLSIPLTLMHEGAHWLAARVAGVPARIMVARRLYLPVLQTDLTALWALPRARRFGPLLAGMAFDAVLWALALGAQIGARAGVWHLNPGILHLVRVLVLIVASGIVFQFLVFLRTDLYAVLAIGLGCTNLTQVTSLRIKSRLGRLTLEEADALTSADRRDLQVSRWYSGLYLAGLMIAGVYFVAFFLPWALTLLEWSASEIGRTAPTQIRFWEVTCFAALALVPLILPTILMIRARLGSSRRVSFLSGRSG